jgi:hypothetical protein
VSPRPAHRLDVHLDAIEQLANSSRFDSRRRWVLEDPAIDYMADELRAARGRRRAHVCVYLPPEAVTQEETEQVVRSTLSLYCRATLRHLDNEIGGIRRQVLRTLWFGFGVLLTVLTLIVVIERAPGMPGVLSDYLTEGLFIVGWVAAWFPIDMALYSRRPMRRDKSIYRRLMNASVEIRSEEYVLDTVTGEMRGFVAAA